MINFICRCSLLAYAQIGGKLKHMYVIIRMQICYFTEYLSTAYVTEKSEYCLKPGFTRRT